jgi:siroheme synthase (precorrin-2 oxidase/ferrochelatase)
MRAYPIFLYLSGRRVVVLGHDEAAERRATLFAGLGAQVERVATASEAPPARRRRTWRRSRRRRSVSASR